MEGGSGGIIALKRLSDYRVAIDRIWRRGYTRANSALNMENEVLVLQKVVGLVLDSDGNIQVREATLTGIGSESDFLEVDEERTWVRFSRPSE